MALEHALLVALSERPGSGLELSRRFDASIGRFWQASHQQIYRTLGRMVGDGWLGVTEVAQQGAPAKKVYSVSAVGTRVLADWLAEPGAIEETRSALAVRLRGARYGDRDAVRAEVERHLAEHRTRLAAYEQMCAADYPRPDVLTGRDRDQYLVLRGGVLMEQFWIEWLGEVLAEPNPPRGDR